MTNLASNGTPQTPERDQTRVPTTLAEREDKEVHRRREVMFPERRKVPPGTTGTPAASAAGAEAEPASPPRIRDAVGLALSGGGIRSASFNLGLLQALTERGVIRWVDYLSTVSGGGFIGTYLSTLLCHPQTGRLSKKLPLVPPKGEETPKPVEKFLLGGRYLKDGLLFCDRFLIGFLLNFAVWGSLLTLISAVLSALWRLLDCPTLILWVNDNFPTPGRWYTDLTRPFLPALLCFGLWLLSWFITGVVRRFTPRYDKPRDFGKRALRWAGLCFLMGVAVLLATDGIQLGAVLGMSEESPLRARLTSHVVIGWLLAGLIVLNILPFLNPVRIMRSELRAPGKVESAILHYAGGSLLLLLPFCCLFWFAREGFNNNFLRPGRNVVAVDVPQPFAFLHSLIAEGGDPKTGLGAFLAERCRRQLFSVTLDYQQLKEVAHGTTGLADKLQGQDLLTVLRAAASQVDDGLRAYPELGRFLREHDEDMVGRTAPWDRLPTFVDRGGQFCREAEKQRVSGLYRTTDFLQKTVACYLAHVLNTDVLTSEEPIWIALEFTKGVATADLTKDSQSRFLNTAGTEFLHRASHLRDASLFDDLWGQALLTGGHLPDDARRKLNRLILEVLYGDLHLEQSRKAGYSLLWWDDQGRRLVWIIASLLTFIAFGLFVDLNGTSLHAFYRKKVEAAYVVQSREGEKLRDLDTARAGGPYHFLCATINFFDDWPWKQTEYNSAYTFFFSRLFCGSQALCGKEPEGKSRSMSGYAETPRYCGGNLDVATAAAISGAAFSPAIIRNPLLFGMTMLLNIRLGQWLPNPAHAGEQHTAERERRRVTVFPLLRDFVLTRLNLKKPDEWQYCFVSDGGHNDNLGVSPLIFRRCRLLIISDATGDPQYHFADFLKAYRRYRIRGGMHFCRLENWADVQDETELPGLDLDPLSPKPETVPPAPRGSLLAPHAAAAPARSARHFLLARLHYPKQERGAIVVYLKTTMTGDEPADLRQYQIEHREFPQDPTTDQSFDENQVESYRQLGSHIGHEFCETLLHGCQRLGREHATAGDLWQAGYSVDELVDLLLLGYFAGHWPDDPDRLLKYLELAGTATVAAELATQIGSVPSCQPAQRTHAVEQLLRRFRSTPRTDAPLLTAVRELARPLHAASDQASQQTLDGIRKALLSLFEQAHALPEIQRTLEQGCRLLGRSVPTADELPEADYGVDELVALLRLGCGDGWGPDDPDELLEYLWLAGTPKVAAELAWRLARAPCPPQHRHDALQDLLERLGRSPDAAVDLIEPLRAVARPLGEASDRASQETLRLASENLIAFLEQTPDLPAPLRDQLLLGYFDHHWPDDPDRLFRLLRGAGTLALAAELATAIGRVASCKPQHRKDAVAELLTRFQPLRGDDARLPEAIWALASPLHGASDPDSEQALEAVYELLWDFKRHPHLPPSLQRQLNRLLDQLKPWPPKKPPRARKRKPTKPPPAP